MTTSSEHMILQRTQYVASGSTGRVSLVECSTKKSSLPVHVQFAVKRMRCVTPDDTMDVCHEATAMRLLTRLDATVFPAYHGICKALNRANACKAYLAMQYVAGDTMHVGPPPAPNHALTTLFELLYGLASAQMAIGIRHGDIKDANIILQPLPAHRVGEVATFSFSARRHKRGHSDSQLRPVWTRSWRILREAGSFCPFFIDFGFTSWQEDDVLQRRWDEWKGRTCHSDRDRAGGIGCEMIATIPAPDMLFWPQGERASGGYARDTFALAFVFFCYVAGCTKVALNHSDEEQTESLLSAIERGMPPAMLETNQVRPPYIYALLLVQEALGNGLLPSVDDIAPGESAVLDAWRSTLNWEEGYQTTNPYVPLVEQVRVTYGDAFVDLLRTMMAWSDEARGSAGAREQPDAVETDAYQPAFHALQHAYFAPLSVTTAAPLPPGTQFRWHQQQFGPLNGEVPLMGRRLTHWRDEYSAVCAAMGETHTSTRPFIKQIAADIANKKDKRRT